MTLGEKIDESYNILRYAIDNYRESLALTFSGGKDSLVVLHMTRTLCDDTVKFPVFSIDTGIKFPETMQFRDKIASLWNLNLIVLKNPEAAKIIGNVKDKRTCCQNLKIQPLKAAISEYKIQGLITAIRWDEQEARTMEEPLSPGKTRPT